MLHLDSQSERPSLSISGLCRLDSQLVECIVEGRHLVRIALFGAVVTALGSAAYGFVFGIWRAIEQGLYSAIKLPILLFAIVLATSLANGIVAQLLRIRIGILQGVVVVMLSLGLTATLLGALAPIALFLSLAVPGPLGMTNDALTEQLARGDWQHLHRTAQWVLLFHIVVIGACGLAGNVRLYALLRRLSPSVSVAQKVFALWILTDAFVGTQLSWILRPYLCKPGLPPAFLREHAWDGNFFEELWRIVTPFVS